jgi:hypothetical protein
VAALREREGAASRAYPNLHRQEFAALGVVYLIRREMC